MLDPVDQVPADQVHGPGSVHVPDLVDHLVPVALADRVQADPAEAHLRPAKRRVRSVLPRAEAVVDGHSIRRRKKAQ